MYCSLCSRDLENLLSHLIPACDSDAVPHEVLFHSHVLHPQHRHPYLDVVVYGLCGLVLVVVYGSLECCQLGWNLYTSTFIRSPAYLVRSVGSHSITNCLQASNPPLTPALWHLLVQRGSCSCHHQNVVHLAPEVRVESWCRRCCLRELILIPLIHFSLKDQSAYFIGSPSNWSGFPITRVSTTPACTRCLGVLDMLCTCCARSFSFSCEYRHRRLLLLQTYVQLLDRHCHRFLFL